MCVRIGSWVDGFGKVAAGGLSDDGGGGCVGKGAAIGLLDEVLAEEAPGEIGEMDEDMGEGG